MTLTALQPLIRATTYDADLCPEPLMSSPVSYSKKPWPKTAPTSAATATMPMF